MLKTFSKSPERKLTAIISHPRLNAVHGISCGNGKQWQQRQMKFRLSLILANTYSFTLSRLLILISTVDFNATRPALNIWFRWKKEDNREEAAARHQDNLQIEYNCPLILNSQHCSSKPKFATHKLHLFFYAGITCRASWRQEISLQFSF